MGPEPAPVSLFWRKLELWVFPRQTRLDLSTTFTQINSPHKDNCNFGLIMTWIWERIWSLILELLHNWHSRYQIFFMQIEIFLEIIKDIQFCKEKYRKLFIDKIPITTSSKMRWFFQSVRLSVCLSVCRLHRCVVVSIMAHEPLSHT